MDAGEHPDVFGLGVVFTKNIDKQTDYVNGMAGVVEGVKSVGVRVRTDTGYTVMVFPWTDEFRNTFLPIHLGYSSTLLKVQGATIPHMTM